MSKPRSEMAVLGRELRGELSLDKALLLWKLYFAMVINSAILVVLVLAVVRFA